MAQLVFLHPDFAGKTYKLIAEKTTVGRGDNNTLVVHHHSVSSNHCEILVYGAEVIVRDLDSRNGTFVNGALLRNQQSAVKSGQTIRFGSIEARLEIEFEDEDPSTDMTAIVSHSRIMRDQRRAQRNPAPNPAATLDPANQEDAASQRLAASTATVAKSPAVFVSTQHSAAPYAKPPSRRRTFPATTAIVLVIAIALGALIFFFWFR